ncbi:sodium-dependent bicarbonate transport family permease [Engelhardtia mirabilis]|uniref:sodium-dependent bicarbonate transport family permease n=1 Tax=Engelhardtia mirabilis TaxID=2528011 RepID=UPI003AF33D74
MDKLLQNILTPPVLFFLLGIIATLVRSDLEIPRPITRALSLYLLFSIGMHGGAELSASGMGVETLTLLGAAVLLASVVPLLVFPIVRKRLNRVDAAGLAATYGSISAVTFVTAVGFLNEHGTPFSGAIVAAMALMESPAIVIGVVMGQSRAGDGTDAPWRDLLRDAFLNGTVILLLGSLVIGFLGGDQGWERVKPFAYEPFYGVLCLFLLDMGLAAGRRLSGLRESGAFLILFGLLAPPIQACLAIALGLVLGFQPGDILLLAVLGGSASYIAVPAALRIALPAANPGIYVPLALAVTFPFNITVGIPLYDLIIRTFTS